MQALGKESLQRQEWDVEQAPFTVSGGARGAMDSHPKTRARSGSRPRPSIESPRDLPTPEAHLPLRKASAHRLHTRKGGVPRPLFAPSGIQPSPVQPLPHIDNFTASNEHAFAGRDARRPFKPPMAALYNQHQYAPQHTERSPNPREHAGRPPSSPSLPPPPPSPYSATSWGKSLRTSKSLGEGLRGLKQRITSGTSSGTSGYDTPDRVSPRPSNMKANGVRESYRSALTSHSSFAPTSSINTDRTSFTGNSSQSDFVKLQPEDWHGGGDVDMSVEDAIGMYENGFESAVKQSFDIQSVRSINRARNSFEVRSLHAFDRPASQPDTQAQQTKRPNITHRRSQSASILLGLAKPSRPDISRNSSLEPPTLAFTDQRTSMQIISNDVPDSRPSSSCPNAVPRDRYGFKKASQYVTVAQYDAWNASYSAHLERRSKKWHALMRSYGLSTTDPFRFPPKSDKIKRYVRKGIPPKFRGAAWFWYAGGPGKLAKEQGLYKQLVDRVENGGLGETDREHIERDLNRTFPDNVRFKPDPTTTLDMQAGAGGGGMANLKAASSTPRKKANGGMIDSEPEMPILQALRRVLQAFAIHNPNIGYCQSLNFIAGLLLLFLDQDEEKAFILLNIVTTQHLPGTHGVALEGANIDIAVLMSCIKDSQPAVWAKLDDKGGGLVTDAASSDPSAALRLPTVSLATTAWFMSLFVGTLPIESVLRVWDCLFFEGSKTLFRIALAIFKFGEGQILRIQDPMEIFQVVQTIPRAMLDVNGLMEVCFRRRGGFGGISQGLIEGRREERRRMVKEGFRTTTGLSGFGGLGADDPGRLRKFTRRVRSRTAKS